MLIPVFLMYVQDMDAQQPPNRAAGIYYLQGVMETASGFKLNADSSFEFFFSQGALDRYGSGKWTLNQGNKLVFNSKPRPEYDFALLQTRQVDNEGIMVQVTDQNTILLSYVYVTIEGGGKKQELITNSRGAAVFQSQTVESITLQFEFCPEKKSVFRFTDTAIARNYFSFRFEPWLFELFFEQFELELTSTGMKGAHPLLGEKSFWYLRAGN